MDLETCNILQVDKRRLEMKRRHIFGITELGESGRSVGQTHHSAKLTDAEVDAMRTLHDQGHSLRQLAKIFGCAKSSVQSIVTCRTRAQIVVAVRHHKPDSD